MASTAALVPRQLPVFHSSLPASLLLHLDRPVAPRLPQVARHRLVVPRLRPQVLRRRRPAASLEAAVANC
jgi:hypothetical protein